MQTVVTQYRDLARWDVKSFLLFSNIGADHVRLGTLLRKKQNQWNGTDDVPMLSLHFGGEFSQRGSNQIKGKLFVADKGDLVYSKIDLRNGAIGIIPDQYAHALFTAEFPIYEIDTAVIHPVYLQLYLQSSAFKNLINSIVSGASGRKRVKPSDFENLFVHVLLKEIQQNIINSWNNACLDAEAVKKSASEIEGGIDNYVLSSLGLKKDEISTKGKFFIARFKEIVRWDFEWNSQTEIRNEKSIKYQTVPLSTVLTKCQSGTWGDDPKGHDDYKVLRSTNIQNNAWVWDDTALRNLSAPDLNKFKLEEGDILITKSSGSKDHIGKSAYVTREIEMMHCAFSNFMQRLSFDKSQILPLYAYAFISCPYIREKMLRLSTTTTGLRNLNIRAINDLMIPIPPLSKQKEIADKVFEMRDCAMQMRIKATNIVQSAKADIEKTLI